MARKLTRRHFLKSLGATAGAAMLANMGLPAVLAQDPKLRGISQMEGMDMEDLPEGVQVIVGDVLSFNLDSDEWEGDFGWVKFRLNRAWYNGEDVYYIRTDASDEAYAEENGLVWVPLLNTALSAEGATSPIYTFENAADDQYPVVSTIPEDENYSPALHVHSVTFNGDPVVLTSAEEILAAEEAGDITIEALPLVVNHPFVKWPGNELQEDPDKLMALGGGPLVSPVDTENMEVNFKLHKCFPSSRYIITDTSAAPMAPMMAIAPSPVTSALQDTGGTDEIWVFGNGIEGPGVMGFQPGVFDHDAGNPIWSPFWDHFTILWNNPEDAVVVRSSEQIRELEEAGLIEIFNGTPDTHPNGFVVNCPTPVLAPLDFEA